MKYRKNRLLIVGIAMFLFVIILNSTFDPLVFYNTSSSIPKGFYIKTFSGGELEKGEIVVFDPPLEIAQYANERGYLPGGISMMKKVAATEGDDVKIIDGSFLAAGECYGELSSEDSSGRSLEPYPYDDNYKVAKGEFIAVGTHPRSWDSRYYGPIPTDRIKARVRPLYLMDDKE